MSGAGTARLGKDGRLLGMRSTSALAASGTEKISGRNERRDASMLVARH
jgi:hypothetical protein